MSNKMLQRSILAALVVLSAGSAAGLELNGFEVRGGLTAPSAWDPGFTLGVAADLGEVWIDNLYLYPAISYQMADESERFFGSSFDLEVSSLALGAEVRYFLDDNRTGWYFGGGPYLHLLERELVVSGTRVVSTDSQEPGVTGVGGYRLAGGLFAEGRYMVVSDFNQAQVLLGFSF
jgi:hypothetical protein